MFLGHRPLPPLPQSFVFGVATADHQCEAYLPGSDDVWDLWEQKLGLPRRERATDFWNRFTEDISLARELGCRAFRFSIAWSRIEPTPGQFDDAAFEHYRRLLETIRDAGLEPYVTLLHFVWPAHVQERGGPIADDFPARFERYVAEVVKRLGRYARYWIPINEPNGLVYGYIKPWWQSEYSSPPGLPPEATLDEQIEAVGKLMRNLFLAHTVARSAIKRGNPDAQVGSNPLPLGLPPWLQSFLDRNATHLRSQQDLVKQAGRLAVRPLGGRADVDVLAAMLSRTAERAQKVAYSTDYYVANERLFAKSTSSLTSASDLVGRKVAVVGGSTAEQFLLSLVPNAHSLVVDDYAEALRALNVGTVDAILADDTILQALTTQTPDQYKTIGGSLRKEPYAVAIPHGDQALLHIVNIAVQRFKESSAWTTSVRQHLGEAATTPPPSSRTLSEPTRNWLTEKSAHRADSTSQPIPLAHRGTALRRIQDRGYLIAGVRTDVPGFGYRGPTTDEYSGLEIDLVRAIAQEIFGDPKRVRLRPVTTATRVSHLRTFWGILDPLLKIYSIVTAGVTSNWWHLGMAGKLPTFVCPAECIGQQDFVGFDYYWGIRSLRVDRIQRLIDAANRQFSGAPVWPAALYDLLKYHARLFPGLPIVICENGCVEAADGVKRATYLRRHVHQVQRAVSKGMPVIAYHCWSITTNREWGTTFGPGNDFGLFHIELDKDPELRRVPTPSRDTYEAIIERRSSDKM